MTKRETFLGLLLVSLAVSVPLFAGDDRPAPFYAFTSAITKLNHEPQLAALIQQEYGTRDEELRWATERSLSWGEITVVAYIQATTGKTFAEIVDNDARRDFWSYANNAGMNCERMARSLESFLKRSERARNSRIFDELRASRRVRALPDLGSGFGLFQEALDFRHIELPQPTKEHAGTGILAKGEK
jgi:hypothetical protein